ncbi:MAG: hypothetical protein AB8G18_12705 [Gammaproteobacteria bacterium]
MDVQYLKQYFRRTAFAVFLGTFLSAGCTTPTVTYTTYTCNGEAGCCCNSPIYADASNGSGNWPDCSAGYECRAMQPGGVTHPSIGRLDVNVCKARSAPLPQPVSIGPTQPAYCRADLAP